jgi:exoribonuclease R
LLGAVNFLVDVTEQRRAEQALRDSEDERHRLQEQLSSLTRHWDPAAIRAASASRPVARRRRAQWASDLSH